MNDLAQLMSSLDISKKQDQEFDESHIHFLENVLIFVHPLAIKEHFEPVIERATAKWKAWGNTMFQFLRFSTFLREGRLTGDFALALKKLHPLLSPQELKAKGEIFIRRRLEDLQQEALKLENDAVGEIDEILSNAEDRYVKFLIGYLELQSLAREEQLRIIKNFKSKKFGERVTNYFFGEVSSLETMRTDLKMDSSLKTKTKFDSFLAQYNVKTEIDTSLNEKSIGHIIYLTKVLNYEERLNELCEKITGYERPMKQNRKSSKINDRGSGGRKDTQAHDSFKKKSTTLTHSAKQGSKERKENATKREKTLPRKVDPLPKNIARIKRDHPVVCEILTLLKEMRNKDLYSPCSQKRTYLIPKSFVESSHIAQQAYLRMNTPQTQLDKILKKAREASATHVELRDAQGVSDRKA